MTKIQDKVLQIAGQYEQLKKEHASKSSELEEVKQREQQLKLEKEQLQKEVSRHSQEKQMMAEEAQKLKQSLAQSASSSPGVADKDKVARLAGMIKKLHQLKSEYKKADSNTA